MKKFILFIFFLLCLSSCSFDGEFYEISGDFFSGRTVSSEEDFTCLILTDMHYGRTGDKIYFMNEDFFFDWLNGKDIDFVMNLGDISDHNNNQEFNSYEIFCNRINNNFSWEKDLIFEAVGNHDIKNDIKGSRDPFIKATGETCYGVFSCSDVSIYRLDSASRALGRTQLKSLREAMEQDSNKKIIISHYPLFGFIDVYTYFALVDPLERNTILSLMAENNCPLYLCGHNHNGFADYDFGNNVYQENLSSYCGSTSSFENGPVWYLGKYDKSENQFVLEEYCLNNGEVLKNFTKVFNFR